MSRKTLVLGFLFCQGVATSLAVAAGPFAEELPTTPGQPFSAVAQTQSTTVFADGNRIVRTNTVRYFRDGEGRTRTERDMGPAEGSAAQSRTMITINDPVGAVRYVLNPQKKSAMVLKLPAGALPPEATEDGPLETTASFGLLGLGMALGANPRTVESASDTTLLGQKVISGVSATGTRVVRTIPSGAFGNEKPIVSNLERWLSPELGVPVQITQQSSIGGTLTLNVSQIVRAEPNPSLFTVPADYTRHEVNFNLPLASASPSTVTVTSK